MLRSISACPSESLEQWEEAGTTLANAVDKYLHLCLSLGTGALKNETSDKNLVTQIDSALGSLHITISQQIAKARSALADTRNKIMSPVYRCPAEVLSEIFSYALHQPANPNYHLSMIDSLVEMYRTLHSLLSVCSAWKNAALARGYFWSTVPMIPPGRSDLRLGFPQATHLSLARSGNADVHLAALIPHWCHDLDTSSELSKHAPQFRTINIASECYSVANRIVDIFGGIGTSGRLSELSIHRKSNTQSLNRCPRGFDYIINPSSATRVVFNRILTSLSVFRLRGVPLSLDQVLFSNRLVELDLQEFTLGYDSEITKIMMALSSAIELRVLKFTSITTFPNPVISQEIVASKVSLLNLHTLLAQDLYGNTLKSLLSAITSRSHVLTLHLTRKTLQVLHVGGNPEPASIDDLVDLFASTTINTLLLDGNENCGWITGGQFSEVLSAVPELKTLKMHAWDFEDDLCEGLQRPSEEGESPYPLIKHLHISSARIWDEDVFQEMVGSYSGSLERMELGAMVFLGSDDDDTIEWGSLDDDDDLAGWLEDNVPEFKLIDYGYSPKEFDPLEWQLW